VDGVFDCYLTGPTILAILKTCLKGKFSEAQFAAIRQWEVPSILTLTTDQEQIQITATNFMKDVLQLRVVHFRDVFHRIHNDCMMATAKSGFMPVFYAGLLVLNLGYGPFQSCGWWHAMLAEAVDLAKKCKPDSPLLLHVWPWIQKTFDAKHTKASASSQLEGKVGRERYLQTIDFNSCLRLKEVKVKLSQWMSFPQAMHHAEPDLASRALVLLSYIMEKNLATNIEEIETAIAKHSFKPKATGLKSKTAECLDAKLKLEGFKKRAKHHLLLATKLLLDPDVIHGMQAITIGIKPVFDWFTSVQRDLKGREACTAFSLEWATSKWLQPLAATFATLEQTEGLEKIGIAVAFRRTHARDPFTLTFQASPKKMLHR
jgi:hypothetical protein